MNIVIVPSGTDLQFTAHPHGMLRELLDTCPREQHDVVVARIHEFTHDEVDVISEFSGMIIKIGWAQSRNKGMYRVAVNTMINRGVIIPSPMMFNEYAGAKRHLSSLYDEWKSRL